jgi:FecR protein
MDVPDRREPDVMHENQIRQLLRLSGRRRRPNAQQMTRARGAAHDAWMRAARTQRWRVWRPVFIGAVAAAAVALTTAVFWYRSSPPAPVPLTAVVHVEVATLRTLVGSIVVTRDGHGQGQVDREVREPGFVLRSGDRLSTSRDSRATLALDHGLAVRLDRDTAVTLESGRITLARGAVYVDAAPTFDLRPLAIATPLGIVRHVGTQFEVRLVGDGVRIRVREGSVVVDRESTPMPLTSHAGEALLIAPNRAVERQPISTSGAEWNWVTQLAEPFQLEGSTLRAFLDWVSREEGWHWQFDNAATQHRAESTVLRGSIDGLTPAEAVDAVLPACGLAARHEGDRLIVSTSHTRAPLRRPSSVRRASWSLERGTLFSWGVEAGASGRG